MDQAAEGGSNLSLKTGILHEALIASLGDEVEVFSADIGEKPLRLAVNLEGSRHDLLIYMYNLVAGTGSRSTECKAVLRVPGQAVGDYGSFETRPGIETVLLAYDSSREVFVFWDAGLHPRFKNGGNIQVKDSTVRSALESGWARQIRKLASGVEEVVLASMPAGVPATLAARLGQPAADSAAIATDIDRSIRPTSAEAGPARVKASNLDQPHSASADAIRPSREKKKERSMQFSLMPEIPMDKTHQLDQSTAKLQTVKDGLPELVKNSKDQYARLGITEKRDRQILVAVHTEAKRLSVFDFAGATAAEFEGWYRWSSRTASRQDLAMDIEGGHGNGGKGFMVRGALRYAYMDSCFKGRRTQMGFQNDDEQSRYKPGYGQKQGIDLNDVEEVEPGAPFHEALKRVGLEFNDLPARVQEIWPDRQAFTVVELNGVKDWVGIAEKTLLKRVADIPSKLAVHGQAAMTIDSCEVWFFVDGRPFGDGPIAATEMEPHKGFEECDPISVPDVLIDPATGEEVSTGSGDGAVKYLQLHTSAKQLTVSDELRPRNCIRIWNSRNNVATYSVYRLLTAPPTIAFVYGRLSVPDLVGSHLADSHRTELAETPLTRALLKWAAGQIETLALEIQRTQISEVKPKDKDKANAALASFRDLMRRYLESDRPGGDDDSHPDRGGDDDGVNPPPPPPPPRWGKRVDEIIVESRAGRMALAAGTSVPITVKAYERDAETNQLLPVKDKSGFVMRGDDSGGIEFIDGSLIRAMEPGEANVWIESHDGSVRSETLKVQAVACSGLALMAPEEPLLQGQRARIGLLFETAEGVRTDLFAQVQVDDPRMATVNRSGYCRAGLRPGTTTVRAMFGPEPTHQAAATLEIGDERVPPRSRQGGTSGNIPEILLCGDPAPGTEELDPQQRTHFGGEDFTTIIEDPIWPDVVWINPRSKESSRVRRSRGGPAGLMGVAAPTFLQFVALKCFEVLKRLWVRQEIGEQSITEARFTQEFMHAEIECAGFIDAAFEKADVLKESQISG